MRYSVRPHRTSSILWRVYDEFVGKPLRSNPMSWHDAQAVAKHLEMNRLPCLVEEELPDIVDRDVVMAHLVRS